MRNFLDIISSGDLQSLLQQFEQHLIDTFQVPCTYRTHLFQTDVISKGEVIGGLEI